MTLLLLFACKDAVVDDSAPVAINLDQVLSEERPSKRSEVYGIADEGSNSILMFGGNEGPIADQIPKAIYLDESWVFEPGTGWTKLDVDGPSARGRYGAAYDPNAGRALVFGGRWREANTSGDYTLYDDLWAFDFATQSWTMLESGGGPAGAYYPVVFFDPTEDALYVYGGNTNANALSIRVSDELWRWTEGGGWEELDHTGAPSQRTFLGETFDTNRQRLVLFGGQKGDFVSQAYNATWTLDMNSLSWTELNDGSNAPSTRMHGNLLYNPLSDRVLLFGGHTDIGDGNDLWALDPDSGDWTEFRPADEFTGNGLGCNGNGSDVPADYVEQDLTAPERRHRGVFALMHDNLWIYGGMHAECSDHLDDTWRFPLDGSGDWTELIEARTGESCLRQNEDCDCLCY
jgi:hypothetical protein